MPPDSNSPPGTPGPDARRCNTCSTLSSPPVMTCPGCSLPLYAGALAEHMMVNGKYRISGVLGRGAFAITYLADDVQLGRSVALKELFPMGTERRPDTLIPPDLGMDFSSLRDRFRDEARTLATFDHRGIVRIFETFDAYGTTYVVMERVHGLTLDAHLRSGVLAPQHAVPLFLGLVDALGTVHNRGLLHRDIKPANLILHSDRGLVLLDFGAARAAATTHTAQLTRILTPAYAAPEQYLASGRVGPPVDFYAFGASLLEALTGATPPPSTERAMSGEADTRLNDQLQRVPPALADTIARCLRLDPATRPQTAADLHELLRRPLTSPTVAPVPLLSSHDPTVVMAQPRVAPAAFAASTPTEGLSAPVSHPAAKPKWPLFAGLGLVAALVVGGGVFALTRDRKPTTIAAADTTVAPDTTVGSDTTATADTTVAPDTTVVVDTTVSPDTTVVADTVVADSTVAPDTTGGLGTRNGLDITSGPDTTLSADLDDTAIRLIFSSLGTTDPTRAQISCVKGVLGPSFDYAGIDGDNPPPRFFRALITCAPDELSKLTVQSIQASAPALTDDQATCVAKVTFEALADGSDQQIQAAITSGDLPDRVKAAIVANADRCGITEALAKSSAG